MKKTRFKDKKKVDKKKTLKEKIISGLLIIIILGIPTFCLFWAINIDYTYEENFRVTTKLFSIIFLLIFIVGLLVFFIGGKIIKVGKEKKLRGKESKKRKYEKHKSAIANRIKGGIICVATIILWYATTINYYKDIYYLDRGEYEFSEGMVTNVEHDSNSGRGSYPKTIFCINNIEFEIADYDKTEEIVVDKKYKVKYLPNTKQVFDIGNEEGRSIILEEKK